MLPAPRWDAGPSAADPVRSSASQTDQLFDLGLGSSTRVEAQIRGWSDLVADADLVVADFAPGAILAARGVRPCLAVGTGYAVPPRRLRRFPPLHRFHPPRVEDEALCEGVNSALAATGRAPLASLPEALTGDASAVCTVPLLDPYRAERDEPVLGSLLSAPAIPRRDDAAGIFCYASFAAGTPAAEVLVAALGRCPSLVTAYLPNLGEADRVALHRAGITVLDAPADVGETLARSRLVVHEGNHGLAASALLAGVPQVAMTTDIEKHLNAAALEGRGVAVALDARTASAGLLATAIEDALHDPVMLREAGRAAEEHAAYAARDVAELVADRCEALL